jgi:hypothetical protein
VTAVLHRLQSHTLRQRLLRVAGDQVMFQSLATLAARCESLPVFQETRTPFFTPGV